MAPPSVKIPGSFVFANLQNFKFVFTEANRKIIIYLLVVLPGHNVLCVRLDNLAVASPAGGNNQKFAKRDAERAPSVICLKF